MSLETPTLSYNPISNDIMRALQAIFGPERASNQPEDLLTYSFDATRQEFPPQAVVWAESEDEICALMRLANEHHFPVYPRGGGTGFTGGALPVHGGVVLSLEHMDAIVELDEANRFVTVQSGMALGELKTQLLAKGLFYPPDPSSAKTATVGGSLAECAGGLNCVKYGVTKEWVQSVRAVLPNGEAVQVGTKARKNVVGYNLLPLLIGSEGTLAVITEATLRLVPYPPHRQAFVALFDSVAAAIDSVQRILMSGVTPSALEFIDRRCLEAANQYLKDKRMPVADALLLVECDGFDPQRIQDEQNTLIQVSKDCGAQEIHPAQSEEERMALWSIRKNLSPAMHAIAPFKTNEDICVPISEIQGILQDAYEIGDRYKIATLCFGHAGDGNLHVNFMTHNEHDPNIEAAVAELFKATIKRQGSISGEHGIGVTKAPYLEMEVGTTVKNMLIELKKMFDPNNILNPDKIVVKTD
ncbi:MAG: FAD-binding oxidoreductase [Candidatus Hinthialibacter antarcticus]|nr:FAD-binding oxidoreductase [Candidatus Hinthialibacter antarcticus]